MTKFFPIILTCTMLIGLTACGNNPPPSKITSAVQPSNALATTVSAEKNNPSTPNKESSNILIAYFTMPETDVVDTVSSASNLVINGKSMGNTQFIAQVIQEETKGDLFKIETVQKYPGSHEPLVNLAKNEQQKNIRPQLSGTIQNLDNYDIIFIGYPNWWGDMPMPLYSFLETTNLSGKTIIPFSTHGGSGFSSTISDIVSLQPKATVVREGFTVSRNNVGNAKTNVKNWLNNLSEKSILKK